MKSQAVPLILLILLVAFTAHAKPTKFKRALVIGGGGITPGFALGIIAGAQSVGFKPDVIIATCGASLGASIAHAYPNPHEAKTFVSSIEFYRMLTKNVSIDTRLVFPLLTKLEKAKADLERMPYLFRENILYTPEKLPEFLPQRNFKTSKDQPRLIVLAAKANFGPENVDPVFYGEPSFRQVYFTDPDTASRLKNYPSPIQKLFPGSRVEKRTEVITTATLTEATRASISDPILINPGKIGNHYYFSGAIDLYPVEMAQSLADEVLITYPSGMYNAHSDMTIFSTFGFAQSNRSLSAGRAMNMRWIDTSGLNNVSFDPQPKGPFLVNHIPNSFGDFQTEIQNQYLLGFNRAIEAVTIRSKGRAHLRHPLPDIQSVQFP